MHDSVSEIAASIHWQFVERKLRLSVAESCTGGLISQALTAQPGASVFFDTGVVCYAISSKLRVLGLDEGLIAKHGAVSDEAALAMAQGVRRISGTDYALAITGNLGPEPMEGKPVGHMHIAVATEGRTRSADMTFEGGREEIRQGAAEAAMWVLYNFVRGA